MASFAKISEENEVVSVHCVADNDTSQDGVENESVGQAFLEKIHKWPAHLWKKCSYNTVKGNHLLGGTPYRGNYPAIGDVWDETNNIFTKPKPYASWTLDTTTGVWNPPVAKPAAQEDVANKSNFRHYSWNEENQQWDVVSQDIWVESLNEYVDSNDPAAQ